MAILLYPIRKNILNFCGFNLILFYILRRLRNFKSKSQKNNEGTDNNIIKKIKCGVRALQFLSPLLSYFCFIYILGPRHRTDTVSPCYQRKAIFH